MRYLFICSVILWDKFGFTVEPVQPLLLRLVKALLEYGLSGHAARDCRLGWCRDGTDGAILLLRLLLRVGYVEKA